MPTRTMTIRDQIAVLQIAEGFFQSSVLSALLKLDLFERIGKAGKSVDELAEELGTRPDTLGRLLNAGVVFKLLETHDGTAYQVAPRVAAVLLDPESEDYLGNWVRNLDYLRAAVEKLDEAVLSSAPSVDPSAHMGDDPGSTREFTLAMHNYASLRGEELANFVDTSSCRTLLDLGCGPGTYAFHLAARNPNLELYLLDLPGVLEVTREVEQRFQLENEIHYLPLNALEDDVPGTYDLVLVSNTLHVLGEAASRDLIRRLHTSVADGGSLIIQAQFMRDDRRGERWPILLDLIQLCTTPNGRNHSVAETKEWLEEAGFSDVEYQPMTLLNMNSLLRAYKL